MNTLAAPWKTGDKIERNASKVFEQITLSETLSSLTLTIYQFCVKGWRHRRENIKMGEPDVMTWFPKKSDYDIEIAIAPDESYQEKIQR